MTCADLTQFINQAAGHDKVLKDAIQRGEGFDDVPGAQAEIEKIFDECWEYLCVDAKDVDGKPLKMRHEQYEAIQLLKRVNPKMDLFIESRWTSRWSGHKMGFGIDGKGSVMAIDFGQMAVSDKEFNPVSLKYLTIFSAAKYLTLIDVLINNSEFLSELMELESLRLYRNNTDLTKLLHAIENLPKLKCLQMDGELSDISAFNNMDLETLWINLVGVNDLTPLLHLENLKTIWFRNGDALKTVAKISSLEHVEVTSNEDVTDYSPLLSMPNLKIFTSWQKTENLGRNHEIVEELRSRGVRVSYD